MWLRPEHVVVIGLLASCARVVTAPRYSEELYRLGAPVPVDEWGA